MEKLEALKYRDLQKLAKEAGIKANLPKQELVEALIENKSDSQNNLNEKIQTEEELNKTFEISEAEQNTLNETFEMEVNDTTLDQSSKSFVSQDSSHDTSGIVQFMNKTSTPETNAETCRKTKSQEGLPKTPASLSKYTKGGRKSLIPTPQDYLTKKNKTPLRGTAKTPGRSISKVTSQIPRFVEFARNRKVGNVPNFAKMHEKNFNKMESLDSLVVKRNEKLAESVSKNKAFADKVTQQLESAKAAKKTHENIVVKLRAKLGLTGSKSFVPAITSTAKMNLNFGSTLAPPDENKVFQFSAAPVSGVVKREAKQRKELKSATKAKLPIRERIAGALKGYGGSMRPFGNITNDKSLGRTPPGKKFDLAASLAKPLNYEPKKGKLKPVEKERLMVNESNTTDTTIKGVRMNRRADLLMQRRNIM